MPIDDTLTIPIMGRDSFSASPVLQTETLRREAPRYIFFAGDLPDSRRQDRPAGGIDLGSPCIKPFSGAPGFVHRCVITPMLLATKKMVKEEIPEGMPTYGLRDEGHAAAGATNVRGIGTEYGNIPIYPGAEIEGLIAGYGEWGLVEIECLRGMQPGEVQALNLNATIFPDWPSLPATNKELRDYLVGKREEIFKGDSPHRAIYLEVLGYLLRSVDAVDGWMHRELDDAHGRMQLPSTDDRYKGRYDRRDFLFLERTGMARRDRELKDIVTTQQDLARTAAALAAGNNAAPMAEIAEAMKMQSDAIRLLLEKSLQTPSTVASVPATPASGDAAWKALEDAQKATKPKKESK